MTNDPNRPLKVFLCHAHSDAAEVRALYARLLADGVDAWLDKENIIAGQDWDFEIRKAVRASDIVIVCLSQQFNQKGYRQNEVRIALEEAHLQPEGEIFIIPLRLEECDYLESLRRFHGVDMFEERGYDYLMRALRLRAEKIGAVVQSQKGWLKKITAPVRKPVARKSAPVIKKPVMRNIPPLPLGEGRGEGRGEGKKSPQKLNTQVVIAIVGAVATILAAILGSLPWKDWFAAAPDVTVTRFAQATVTLSAEIPPTSTFTPALPTKTYTPVFTPTAMPLSSEITDGNGIKMNLVPAGTFTMGSDNGDTDEKPIHEVYLDSYYMDIYEVTNAAYKVCVGAGACQSPSNTDYYNDSTYAEHPVVDVDWNMAKTYCEWRDGARLPTEAEWEKAARGTDGRTYPWGENISCDKANYNGSCVGDTTVVGSYESGKSPYGMYDMAGNVWEWVNDWYSETYYQSSPSSNPLGPNSGQFRVLRGGSWIYGDYFVRSALRSRHDPSNTYFFLGFRCSRSVASP